MIGWFRGLSSSWVALGRFSRYFWSTLGVSECTLGYDYNIQLVAITGWMLYSKVVCVSGCR